MENKEKNIKYILIIANALCFLIIFKGANSKIEIKVALVISALFINIFVLYYLFKKKIFTKDRIIKLIAFLILTLAITLYYYNKVNNV
mgnify:CR=1 FL=1